MSILSFLPPSVDLESKAVLKKCALTHKHLAELKGFAGKIPNQSILLNAIGLQEAKDSSAIENIVTTHDELYKARLFEDETISPQAKEVTRYNEAILHGYGLVQKRKLLTVNDICAIQGILEGNDAGLRSQSGTVLRNATTGEVVYTPPQHPDEVKNLMTNLEKIINDDDAWAGVDPLIKMAAIHYQFESIHPFFDGNGRTGRIINVLYLVLKELLDAPVLYLSRYIIAHKHRYYQGIHHVQTRDDWEGFVMFMLDAVLETAISTHKTVTAIDRLMAHYKKTIRDELKAKFYSRDVIEALFLYPYTRIQYIQEVLGISRPTATLYLNTLSKAGLLKKFQYGRNHYFVNEPLFAILSSIQTESDPTTIDIVTTSQ
ncbi:MAG: Fic family protein [Kiritimatiellaeota bacterium]|nr:Fic family protein [Kiritimatiellota bacterium]